MARACEICGKTRTTGHNVSHANNKTSKVFEANLQTIRVKDGNNSRKAIVCARCIRAGKVVKAL